MEVFSTHAVKTHLSRLIERALQGEEIVIAKRRCSAVVLRTMAGQAFIGMRGQADWQP